MDDVFTKNVLTVVLAWCIIIVVFAAIGYKFNKLQECPKSGYMTPYEFCKTQHKATPDIEACYKNVTGKELE